MVFKAAFVMPLSWVFQTLTGFTGMRPDSVRSTCQRQWLAKKVSPFAKVKPFVRPSKVSPFWKGETFKTPTLTVSPNWRICRRLKRNEIKELTINTKNTEFLKILRVLCSAVVKRFLYFHKLSGYFPALTKLPISSTALALSSL